MKEDQAPFAWLGHIVTIHVVGMDDPQEAELFEVNDIGIVLRVTRVSRESESGAQIKRNVEPQFSFHPWTNILMLMISEADLERYEEPSATITEE